MSSSNPSSPKNLAKFSIDVGDSQGMPNEEVSFLSMLREVSNVPIGISEKSPIRRGALMDTEHAHVKKLRRDLEFLSSTTSSPSSTNMLATLDGDPIGKSPKLMPMSVTSSTSHPSFVWKRGSEMLTISEKESANPWEELTIPTEKLLTSRKGFTLDEFGLEAANVEGVLAEITDADVVVTDVVPEMTATEQ